LISSIKNLGFSHVLKVYVDGLLSTTPESQDLISIQYESAWRNGQWTVDAVLF